MNVVRVTCARSGCGYSPFPMDEGVNQRARRTHETFHCPSGHPNHYAGESDIERLEREIRWLKQQLARTVSRGQYDQAVAESRRCPWPTCREYVYASRQSMYEHMRRQHDMPTVVLVAEEAV